MPPNSNPWLYLAGLLVSLLTGIGLKDIVIAIFRRKPRRVVEVGNQIELAKQASEYAERLEADADASRKSAMNAWAEVDKAQQKLVRANRKLDDATWKLELAARYLDSILAKIWEPGNDIEAVRTWIRKQPPPPHTRNGNGIETQEM